MQSKFPTVLRGHAASSQDSYSKFHFSCGMTLPCARIYMGVCDSAKWQFILKQKLCVHRREWYPQIPALRYHLGACHYLLWNKLPHKNLDIAWEYEFQMCLRRVQLYTADTSCVVLRYLIKSLAKWFLRQIKYKL